MVELDCLLSSYGLTAIVGSNPTSSANLLRACSSVDQRHLTTDQKVGGSNPLGRLMICVFGPRGSGFGAESANWGNCPVSTYCNVGSVLDA